MAKKRDLKRAIKIMYVAIYLQKQLQPLYMATNITKTK